MTSHRIVASMDPEMMDFPSALKTTLWTGFECPFSTALAFLKTISQTLRPSRVEVGHEVGKTTTGVFPIRDEELSMLGFVLEILWGH